ncbi:MAG TPA: SIR2 family protein [Solirubrobacterales bacterium]|nr:SIR2 family protein [Solirubrobacterales bacterium]
MTSESSGWQDADGESHDQFKGVFGRVLTSRHLLILSGLGTSRCILSDEGQAVAPTMADLWIAVRAANEKSFDSILRRVGWGEQSQNVELLLSRCQMEQALRPSDELKAFIAAGEKAIATACDFVTPKTDLNVHELFLRKIARRSAKLPRAQIFTTNYDLAFEAAAARIGFATIDGFTATLPARFDPVAFDRDLARRESSDVGAPLDWVPNVMQLHKLHGSIDWSAVNGAIYRERPMDNPVIVYPRASKFEASYQQPFLELMSRFQTALRRGGTGLIVAGSGFEDRHIAEPFLAAVRGNVGINIVVLSRSLEKKENRVTSVLKRLIANGDRRLALVAGSFEGLVQALPDLVAVTEEEAHAARVAASEDV